MTEHKSWSSYALLSSHILKPVTSTSIYVYKLDRVALKQRFILTTFNFSYYLRYFSISILKMQRHIDTKKNSTTTTTINHHGIYKMNNYIIRARGLGSSKKSMGNNFLSSHYLKTPENKSSKQIENKYGIVTSPLARVRHQMNIPIIFGNLNKRTQFFFNLAHYICVTKRPRQLSLVESQRLPVMIYGQAVNTHPLTNYYETNKIFYLFLETLDIQNNNDNNR